MNLTESILEDAALTWFKELGYAVAYGPHIAPGRPLPSATASATRCSQAGFGTQLLA